MEDYRNVVFKKGCIDNNYNPFEINGIREVLYIIDNLMNKHTNIYFIISFTIFKIKSFTLHI